MTSCYFNITVITLDILNFNSLMRIDEQIIHNIPK